MYPLDHDSPLLPLFSLFWSVPESSVFRLLRINSYFFLLVLFMEKVPKTIQDSKTRYRPFFIYCSLLSSRSALLWRHIYSCYPKNLVCFSKNRETSIPRFTSDKNQNTIWGICWTRLYMWVPVNIFALPESRFCFLIKKICNTKVFLYNAATYSYIDPLAWLKKIKSLLKVSYWNHFQAVTTRWKSFLWNDKSWEICLW